MNTDAEEKAKESIKVLDAMLSTNQWEPVRAELEFAINEVKNAFQLNRSEKGGILICVQLAERILVDIVVMDIMKILIMNFVHRAGKFWTTAYIERIYHEKK